MRNHPTSRLLAGALLVLVVTALGSYWIGSTGGTPTPMAMNLVKANSGSEVPQLAPGQQVGMPRFIVTDIQTRPSAPKPKPKK
ncbi:MAG: hypothetical protein K1Y02_07875 [Candidatus Hydrogenedentes bacterium]|nr:hypothetical protein [Candidatus Hydrogenedentota bacterium]